MLSYRGFSAWISVDDQALPEYLVAVDSEAHRVSCWIPGEEGKTFTVWWKDHGGKVDTCSFITLDGLVVPGRFLLGDGVASRSGARASHITERPFTFMKVPENAGETQESNKDVGTIVLRVKRVNRVASRPSNPLRPLPSTTVPAKRQAGDLCVGFGPEQATSLQYSSTWQVVPHDKAPESTQTKASTYVSFIFRYRSQEFLRAQGIAPEIRQKMAPEPRVGEKRRVASLPLVSTTGIPVTPSPSPPKRPRLTGPVLNDQVALGHRKPTSDPRRAVSCRTPLKTEPDAQQNLFLEHPRLGLDFQLFPPNSALSDATTEDESHS